MPATTPAAQPVSAAQSGRGSIIVQKFGGSSVADADKIKQVARIIVDTHEKGHRVVSVVSAMGKTTDGMVALATELTVNPAGRDYDALLATGEMITTAAMAMAINAMGYKAVGLNGGQAGIHTEDLFNRARILEIDTKALNDYLDQGYIVIVTGFQGINSKGEITTLGRGGSDTSAVALASALGAERCDIYTDVRGVYSTDPRIVPEAVKIDEISYMEMMELARVGAKVLHARAVELARQGNVRLSKRSTFHLEDPGTVITDRKSLENDQPVTGIAIDNNQARVAIVGVPDRPGIAAEVFGTLAAHNISVDMIIQSQRHQGGEVVKDTNDIAFTVTRTDLHDALKVLEAVRQKLSAQAVVSDDEIAKVSIVGAGMVDRPGIAADLFQALSEAGINIRMIATSEIKISCLVDKAIGNDAVRTIHKKFFPNAKTPDDVMVNEKVGY
ncbi:MAG: aspartate kinase [Candidatus Melainabacteria bacterium]